MCAEVVKLVDLPAYAYAEVVKLVDTHGSEPCERKFMGVQVSPSAKALAGGHARFRAVRTQVHGSSSLPFGIDLGR